jgi:cbb3-type cytochrome oxidase maturation protein
MSTTQLAVILFLVVALFVILFIGFFAWAVKSGQFRDVEGIKYRMLEDHDEEEGEDPAPATDTLPEDQREQHQ